MTVTPGAGAGSWAECPCDAAAGRLARVFVPDPEESRATRRLGHGTGVGRGPSVEGQARRGGADFCATGQGTPGGMGCSLSPWLSAPSTWRPLCLNKELRKYYADVWKPASFLNHCDLIQTLPLHRNTEEP